jgi:hypothetical protein
MSQPLHGVNGSLVNIDNSQFSGSAFTSRVIPSTVNPNVLPEPLNKGEAANSYIPCASSMKGGKIHKRKIKNISNKYKMAGGKNRLSKIKKQIMKFFSRKGKSSSKRSTKSKSKRSNKSSKSKKSSRKTRKQRGGYAQYQNNLPMTQTYSLGGKLDPSMSALASPPPHHVLSNCTNCVDNYDRFTNSGFPSRGWW